MRDNVWPADFTTKPRIRKSNLEILAGAETQRNKLVKKTHVQTV